MASDSSFIWSLSDPALAKKLWLQGLSRLILHTGSSTRQIAIRRLSQYGSSTRQIAIQPVCDRGAGGSHGPSYCLCVSRDDSGHALSRPAALCQETADPVQLCPRVIDLPQVQGGSNGPAKLEAGC